MAFPIDRINQFVVHFACRIPARNDMSSADRKALENVLQELDPDLFQLFPTDVGRKSPYLFESHRQYLVEAATVTVPSFVLSGNSVTLLNPVKLGGKFLSRTNSSLSTSHLNKKMTRYLIKFQDTLRALRYNRAGKIFEYVLGPFNPDEKEKLFKSLFNLDLKDVGGIKLLFSRYVDIDKQKYNIQTSVEYQQAKLDQSFRVGVRVDINNRDLKESLDPREIERIWSNADAEINDHLDNLIINGEK